MSKEEVERFLVAGGEDKHLRLKYDQFGGADEFVAAANEEGYDYTEEELMSVIKESGDSFDSFGNPRKRAIWWY